ncbi:SipW-dependent-type signal peptide-containing protein [Candidatus Parcubacteria bacterium]|nr:SipW-dependent-type signal peptide-containing protein [Candidatus Parcubacteria bacterium]
MNKAILISLSIIAAVGVIAVGGTVAYFSDTETSTGNTFTAGEINLEIDNQCSWNGGINNCPWEGVGGMKANWALTDLQDGVHKFFYFGDIKPGAWGEDTISLHLYDNPAWAWLKIGNVVDNENGCNEPEGKVDTSCGDPGVNEGELYENMHFLIWMDDGDNIYEAGERIMHDGEILDACEIWRLDGGPCCVIDPFVPCSNYYVGIKWCFGVFEGPNYTCNGLSIGNEAQTDSMTMDVSFMVVQTQNNQSALGGPTCP